MQPQLWHIGKLVRGLCYCYYWGWGNADTYIVFVYVCIHNDLVIYLHSFTFDMRVYLLSLSGMLMTAQQLMKVIVIFIYIHFNYMTS